VWQKQCGLFFVRVREYFVQNHPQLNNYNTKCGFQRIQQHRRGSCWMDNRARVPVSPLSTMAIEGRR
jgi:hypothetical protein